MTRHTQAEIFIKTLEELRNDERERQTARLRSQIKAHANRFLQAFHAEFPAGGHSVQGASRKSMPQETAR